jgi:hypothetical protein
MDDQLRQEAYWDWDEAARAISRLPAQSVLRICSAMVEHWVEEGRDAEELIAIMTRASDHQASGRTRPGQ